MQKRVVKYQKKEKNMQKELSNKVIYEDFKSKTVLTSEEKEVLDMLIQRESLIKIAQKVCMSERKVSRIIKDLKEKYDKYKKLEIAKLCIFLS